MRTKIKKIRITPILTVVITALLAFLFVIPVFFALISAFKTNGEI